MKKKKLTPEQEFNQYLYKLVYNYKTKHKIGFLDYEQDELIKMFPDIDMKKYNDAMMCNTCEKHEKDGFIMYHCDVLTALRCGIEKRDMNLFEFD